MSSAVSDPVANSICTASGNYFSFEDPAGTVGHIKITDIAFALSHICRFTGHTRKFYSVAQHSVLVSCFVPPEVALQGLLHDAAEALIGDVSTPLKRMLPDYKVIEKRVEAALFAHFGLPAELDPRVKVADLVLLATERRDLMPRLNDQWHCLTGIEPLPSSICPWAPERAMYVFLDRYKELTQ